MSRAIFHPDGRVEMSGSIILNSGSSFEAASLVASGKIYAKPGASILTKGKKITFTEDCEINELKLYPDGSLKIVTPTDTGSYEVKTDWSYPSEAAAHEVTVTGDCD